MLVLLGGAMASSRGVYPFALFLQQEAGFFSTELLVLG